MLRRGLAVAYLLATFVIGVGLVARRFVGVPPSLGSLWLLFLLAAPFLLLALAVTTFPHAPRGRRLRGVIVVTLGALAVAAPLVLPRETRLHFFSRHRAALETLAHLAVDGPVDRLWDADSTWGSINGKYYYVSTVPPEQVGILAGQPMRPLAEVLLQEGVPRPLYDTLQAGLRRLDLGLLFADSTHAAIGGRDGGFLFSAHPDVTTRRPNAPAGTRWSVIDTLGPHWSYVRW